MDIGVLGGAIAAHRCCHRRRRTGRLARGRHARPRRHRRRAGRSAPGLSAGFPLREARQRPVADAATDRPRRCRDARLDARPGMLGGALRPRRRQAAGRDATRHSLRHAGQHRALADSEPHRVHPRQGHRHCDRPRAADRQAVERRRDFRAPRRAGDRTEHRPAPEARHRPRGHQPRPFDLDRLRRPAGGPAGVPVLRADLFRRAAGRPDGLHHAVPDRRDDARQPVRLSRPARSLAEAIPRRAARDALLRCGPACAS